MSRRATKIAMLQRYQLQLQLMADTPPSEALGLISGLLALPEADWDDNTEVLHRNLMDLKTQLLALLPDQTKRIKKDFGLQIGACFEKSIYTDGVVTWAMEREARLNSPEASGSPLEADTSAKPNALMTEILKSEEQLRVAMQAASLKVHTEVETKKSLSPTKTLSQSLAQEFDLETAHLLASLDYYLAEINKLRFIHFKGCATTKAQYKNLIYSTYPCLSLGAWQQVLGAVKSHDYECALDILEKRYEKGFKTWSMQVYMGDLIAKIQVLEAYHVKTAPYLELINELNSLKDDLLERRMTHVVAKRHSVEQKLQVIYPDKPNPLKRLPIELIEAKGLKRDTHPKTFELLCSVLVQAERVQSKWLLGAVKARAIKAYLALALGELDKCHSDKDLFAQLTQALAQASGQSNVLSEAVSGASPVVASENTVKLCKHLAAHRTALLWTGGSSRSVQAVLQCASNLMAN